MASFFRNSSIVVLWVSILFALSALGQAQPSVTPKRVLVLYWDNKDFPGNVLFDQTFQTTLKSSGSEQIEYYPEYLESTRFPGEEQSAALRDYLKLKYANLRVDVVVAVADSSLEFLLKYRSELFSQSPIVFVAIKRLTPEQLSAGPGMTGIIPANTHRETLDLSLKLQPDTQHVFVVSGTAEHDKRFESVARQQFKGYENRVAFNYFTDLPLEELISKTKTLPKHSIILYVWQQTQNERGKLLETYETVAAFAPFASAPIYGMGSGNLGKGIVGGYLAGSDTNGKRVAQMVREVLNGKRAQDIPLENAPAFYMFDWRELRRWGISEHNLPPGSVVNFRELTLWQSYKWRIIGVLALVALQTLLIAFLLVERRRRQIAAKARRHLATIVESSDDAILSKTLDGRILTWNAGAELMYGYSAAEMIGQQVSKLAPADKTGEVSDIIERIIRGENVDHFETERVTKDGRQIYVSLTISGLQDEHGKIVGASIIARDITKRKESELALRQALERVNELKNQLDAENIYLQSELQQQRSTDIVGESEAIKYVIFKINQVAPTDSTVLIMGETGTGKELVARAIHSGSSRRDRALIRVNCAALSPTLIESELFGHEKGAFTGAGARRLGRFELANGSTLFLDEIGELPMELQAKLLRVIQEGELERVGAAKTIKVDVRIIAATNRNLKLEVDQGKFRQDLWYRLNVFPITVPPLNQRKDDIPLLVDYFVNTSAKKFGKTITSVSATTMRNLQLHSWPGNIRELANVIERAVINSSGSILKGVGLFEQQEGEQTTSSPTTLEEIEREHILRTLERTGWRIEGPNGAAKLLDINASTLRTKMTKLQIRRSRAGVVSQSRGVNS